MEYFFQHNKLSLNFKTQTINIGDIENIEVRKGIFSLSPENYKTEGVPFLRVADLKNGTIVKDSLVYIDEVINEKEKNTQLIPGDLVFSKVGTIDEVSILPKDFDVYNMSQNIIGVKIRNNKLISSEFVRQFFQLDIGKKQLLANSMSGVQPKITLDSIRNIKIPLLSIEEQNHIVGKMDLALKTKKQKKLEAKTLFESIDDFVLSELGIEYKEVEEKKVFGLSLSELGETKRLDSFYNNPKFLELEKMLENGKYEIKKVNDFLDDIKYGASLKNDYSETGIPFLRIKDLEKNKINVEEVVYFSESMRKEIGNCIVNEGDFLVSRSGSVGIVALVEKQFEGFAFGSFMIKFSLKENNLIDKNFLQFWLNNKLNQIFIEQEKIGAIQGNITIDTIKNFKIPLPPLEIQEKIALEVKSRIEKAKILENEAKEVYEKAKKEVEEMILD